MATKGEYFDWRTKSLCGELTAFEWDAMFFPSNGRSINKAKEFCGMCPVQDTCLEWALDFDMWGIVAGTTRKEREQIKKIRNGKPSKKITKRKNFKVR